MLKPTGIVSIPLSQDQTAQKPFEHLMGAAGGNTGNLLFTNAVWAQISGRKRHVGFSFSPTSLNKSLARLVIPAANWFNPKVDFHDLADRVDQLNIPVIMIGLGAQNTDFSPTGEIPEGTVRLIRAVASRSNSISVRGAYTKAVLESYGIKNVTVTGCPSLYHEFAPDSALRLSGPRNTSDGAILLHSTRYSATHADSIRKKSAHRDIFRLGFKLGWDLLLQSEPEEISMIVTAADKPEIDIHLARNMMRLYKTSDWMALRAYIREHSHVFFDVDTWSAAVTGYAGVFGTRLHATIMALNSGVPAVLVHHDSRTKEMCELARIPSISSADVQISEKSIRSALNDCDTDAYLKAKPQNAEIYEQFLEDNGVPHNMRGAGR